MCKAVGWNYNNLSIHQEKLKGFEFVGEYLVIVVVGNKKDFLKDPF